MKKVKAIILFLLLLPEILLCQHFVYIGNESYHLFDVKQKKQMEIFSSYFIKNCEIINDVLITCKVEGLPPKTLTETIPNSINIYKIGDNNSLQLKKTFAYGYIEYFLISPDHKKLAFTSNWFLPTGKTTSKLVIVDLTALESAEYVLDELNLKQFIGWSNNSHELIYSFNEDICFWDVNKKEVVRSVNLGKDIKIQKHLYSDNKEMLIYYRNSEYHLAEMSNGELKDIYKFNKNIDFLTCNNNYITMYESSFGAPDARFSPLKISFFNLSTKETSTIYDCTLSYANMPEIYATIYDKDKIIITLPKYLNKVDNKQYEEGIYEYDIPKKQFTCLLKTTID